MNSIEQLLSGVFADDTTNLSDLFDQRIKELGISRSQAYKALGMDKKSVEPILNNQALHVDTIKLLKIGEFLNLDTVRVVELYLKNGTVDKIADLERTQKAKFIFENFDLPGLKSIGFLKDTKNVRNVEDRIKSFFKIDSIFEYRDERVDQVAFSKTRNTASNKMRVFWIKTAFAQFELINNPFDFNRNHLKQLIARIRPYSRDEKYGFFKVCQALYHEGVTVIFQRRVPRTQVRGATFVVNKKPCIVITDLNDRYGTIWFALLHELYHVLYHLEDIQSRVFHLTGDAELWLENEDEADLFARRYWLSDERFKFITPSVFNQYVVERYAEEWQIHPSIIYNFYCFDNSSYWGGFKKFEPGVKKVVEKINMIAFNSNTIEDTVREIKKNLELN